MSRATKCSLVCGLGHGSLAAITRIAPSIIAAPDSIVAIRTSWPGASTYDTLLKSLGMESLPQCLHDGSVV